MCVCGVCVCMCVGGWSGSGRDRGRGRRSIAEEHLAGSGPDTMRVLDGYGYGYVYICMNLTECMHVVYVCMYVCMYVCTVRSVYSVGYCIV